MKSEIVHRRRLILFGGLTLGIMLAIFLLSAQDGTESGNFSDSFLGSLIGRFLEKILPRLSDQGFEHDIRKYAHMFEYFCLGLSGAFFFHECFHNRGKNLFPSAFLSIGMSFLYACSDEWHQRFVPGRAGQFRDVLIDGMGFCLAAVLFLVLKKIGHRLDNRRNSSKL